MMYPAYIALVIIFVLVIVLQAWFVRRLSNLRDQAHRSKAEHHRLRAEMMELSETVSDLRRGKDSNQTSLQGLEREIESGREKIEKFLEEHEELKETFEAQGGRPGSASPAADGAPLDDAPGDAPEADLPPEGDEPRETDPQEAGPQGADPQDGSTRQSPGTVAISDGA